jgi:hypothetical protein
MPNTTTNQPSEVKVPDIATLTSPEFAQGAFEKVKPQLLAMAPEEVLRVTADIPTAASIALGAYGRMVALRPQMVEQLPRHPVQLLDDLPNYAAAAWYAHLVSLPPAGEGERVKKLLEEATSLRDTLLVAAEALAARGLLDADKVADIRAGLGNLDKANDLAALGDLFGQAWPQVASKTAVERAEVERAAALGMELLLALGEKGLIEKPAASPEARDLRARAYTKLIKVYRQCVRAVTYLRWDQEDLEMYAPSLRPRARTPRKVVPAPPTATTAEVAEAKEPEKGPRAPDAEEP